MSVRRPAFHGRSHAVGTGISRRVGQRVQGPQGSWSIGVKLGPIQGGPLAKRVAIFDCDRDAKHPCADLKGSETNIQCYKNKIPRTKKLPFSILSVEKMPEWLIFPASPSPSAPRSAFSRRGSPPPSPAHRGSAAEPARRLKTRRGRGAVPRRKALLRGRYG